MVIRIVICLQFSYDEVIEIILASIQLRQKWTCSFFAESKSIAANKKALQGSGWNILWRNSLCRGNTNGIHTDRGGNINFYQIETRLWDANDEDYTDINNELKHWKELLRSYETKQLLLLIIT